MARRINRAIDLLEAGHPIYALTVGEVSYEDGRRLAQGWPDCIIVDFEHNPFDTVGLVAFMKGLVDGGPTEDGYRMRTVVATLPSNCRTPAEMEANAWQVRHVLSAGVHGVLHTHARRADAVRTFVQACRYPFQRIGVGDGLGEGERGAGGQAKPAELWDISPAEYTSVADPWPLNPRGELLLGLKIEDRHCVATAESTAAVPGIAFAEWGPGDMGMSYGYPDAHDPPYPEELEAARNTIKAACDKAGLHFMSSWNDPAKSVEENLQTVFDWGATIIVCDSEDVMAAGLRLRPRS